jgi:GT2 family glycosyltransferase
MKLVILVLNWNRCAATRECLASLRQAELGGAEIIVIDNGSHDGSVDTLRAAEPDVRLLALPENRGYAGGNNAGLRVALDEGAERILVLNNDTTVAADFLPALMRALDETPRAGAVCAAVHRSDRPEMLNVAYSEVHFTDRNAVQLRGVNALPGEGFATRQIVPAIVGCCVLFRSEALREVGLFDEAFFAYHEDIDWSLRAGQAGWLLLYEPYARVYHARSGSTALDELPEGAGGFEPGLPNAEPVPFNPIRTYLGARNLMRLVKKHTDPRSQRTFAARCAAGLPLEYTAVLFNREGTLQLKLWTYAALWEFLRTERPPLWRTWRGAERSGRTAQVRAYMRGLWDGWWDRPLPLEKLGLR